MRMECIVDLILSLPPKAATLVSVLIGFVLIDDLNADQQEVLGSFIITVGNILAANAINQAYAEDRQFDKEFEEIKDNVEEIDELKKEIKELRELIEKMNNNKSSD